MNVHSNARTCPNSRAAIVDHFVSGSWSENHAAVMKVSTRTAYKWLRRFRDEGLDGLVDRSSRPRSMPSQTEFSREELVIKLRHCRLTSVEIGRKLRMPRSTVAAILKRVGLSRLRFLEPPEIPVRYERDAPGDLLHLDIKKLGRIAEVGHRITGIAAIVRAVLAGSTSTWLSTTHHGWRTWRCWETSRPPPRSPFYDEL